MSATIEGGDRPLAGERDANPLAGEWAIAGCDFPDDKRTTNQYRGRLVPCPEADEE